MVLIDYQRVYIILNIHLKHVSKRNLIPLNSSLLMTCDLCYLKSNLYKNYKDLFFFVDHDIPCIYSHTVC